MKLCKDCKWYNKYGMITQCTSPKNTLKPDLVSGKISPRWFSCKILRDKNIFDAIIFNLCGKRGRWWEPKDV